MYTRKEAENIVNIGMTAGTLLSQRRIMVNDSVDLTNTIIKLGKRFELATHFGDKENDYLTVIDEYAQRELVKRYPVIVIMNQRKS